MAIIAKCDGGQSVDEICREHQISPATFYKWRREIKENEDEDKRLIKELKTENARLKKRYAELMIDHDILKEGCDLAKNISAQLKRNN